MRSFPEEHIELCHESAIASILNDDAGDLVRVSNLCHHVAESHRRACFGAIGLQFPNLVPDKEQRELACTRVPTEYRELCTA